MQPDVAASETKNARKVRGLNGRINRFFPCECRALDPRDPSGDCNSADMHCKSFTNIHAESYWITPGLRLARSRGVGWPTAFSGFVKCRTSWATHGNQASGTSPCAGDKPRRYTKNQFRNDSMCAVSWPAVMEVAIGFVSRWRFVRYAHAFLTSMRTRTVNRRACQGQNKRSRCLPLNGVGGGPASIRGSNRP